jgi:hypothetical protein
MRGRPLWQASTPKSSLPLFLKEKPILKKKPIPPKHGPDHPWRKAFKKNSLINNNPLLTFSLDNNRGKAIFYESLKMIPVFAKGRFLESGIRIDFWSER